VQLPGFARVKPNQQKSTRKQKEKNHKNIFKNMSENFFKKNHKKIQKMFLKNGTLSSMRCFQRSLNFSNPTSRFIVMSGHTLFA
jgi:hypothetical protein